MRNTSSKRQMDLVARDIASLMYAFMNGSCIWFPDCAKLVELGYLRHPNWIGEWKKLDKEQLKLYLVLTTSGKDLTTSLINNLSGALEYET